MLPDITRVLVHSVLLLSSVLAGCEDLQEIDISDQKITLISPSNGVSSTYSFQRFTWDTVEGATSYRLQISIPNFDTIHLLLVDTVVEDNELTIDLFPGSFSWRVQARNHSSESEWSYSSFELKSTVDLAWVELSLSEPGQYTNESEIVFSWGAVAIAQEYQWELYKGTFGESTPAAPIAKQTSNSLVAPTTLNDGYYEWGVSALSETSRSPYTVQGLMVDLTSPLAPFLIGPPDDFIASSSPTFSWDVQADNGSPIASSFIRIYSDSLKNNLVIVDSTAENSINIDLGSGTYYWSVSLKDAAGNTGIESQLRKVSVQ